MIDVDDNPSCKKYHLRTHLESDILFLLNILNGDITVIGYNTIQVVSQIVTLRLLTFS